MSDSTWHDWFHRMKRVVSVPTKRSVPTDRNWGWQAERLEDRALLSASGVVPADVAHVHGKAAFDYPQVAGTWDLTVDSVPGGTGVLTQKGKTVTGHYTIPGVPELTFKDKFTKSDPSTLSGSVKIKDPELGKFTIDVVIEFPSATGAPITFTGSAHTPQGDIAFTGDKQGQGSSSLPQPAKMPDEFPDVSGDWNFTVSQEQLGTQTGVMHVTQDGKGHRNVNGTVDLGEGLILTFCGKFDKSNLFEVSGTTNVPVNGSKTVKAKTAVTFNIEYDFFGGNATSNKIGTAEISANKVLT